MQWDCPRCTLLVPLKSLTCTVCGQRRPRGVHVPAVLTPEFPEKIQNEATPPKINSKKKTTTKRKLIDMTSTTTEVRKEKRTAKITTNVRVHQVAERLIQQQKTARQVMNKKRGEYTIDDVRRGMYMMVKGASARQAEKDVHVPMKSLRRNFFKCLGFRHSKHIRIAKNRWDQIEKKIAAYQLKEWGGHGKKVLTNDEEELIVCACEFAAKHCFPWSPSEVLKLAWSMMKKIKPGCPCPGRGWLRGFEKRWQQRLHKVKTGSIDPLRARQATAEVRDAVYDKYTKFRQDLIDRGELTAEQLTHEGDFIINVDEVGGDELGKRIRSYFPKKAEGELKKWRNVEIGGDHNPFHCTSMFGTIASGTIAEFWTVIHSTPGCKSRRVRDDYVEGLPGR